MWDHPRPGLEPVFPALAGRFSTTAPPGKPRSIYSFPSVFNSHSLLGKSYFLSLALSTLHKLAPNYLCRIFSQYSTSLLQQLNWSIYRIREVLCRILHYEQGSNVAATSLTCELSKWWALVEETNKIEMIFQLWNIHKREQMGSKGRVACPYFPSI